MALVPSTSRATRTFLRKATRRAVPHGTTAESGPHLVDRALERRLAVVGAGWRLGLVRRVVVEPFEEGALVARRRGSADELLPRDTEEADTGSDVQSAEELPADADEIGGEGGGLGQGARAGDGREVAEAHLQLDGAGGDVRSAQPRRHAVGEPDELVLERGMIVEIGRERLLVTDRLHLLIGDHRSLVAVPGQLVEVLPGGSAERVHD